MMPAEVLTEVSRKHVVSNITGVFSHSAQPGRCKINGTSYCDNAFTVKGVKRYRLPIIR